MVFIGTKPIGSMSGRCDSRVPAIGLGVSRWTWLALLLLNAGVFLWAHGAALGNPLVCNDDVRQQIYWMQQWDDASLYQDDLLTDYARHYVPWGVKGLYWIAARAVPPLVFAKGLSGVLFIGLGLLLFSLGRRLSGPAAGWFVVGVYWLMPFFLDHISGGLARSFAAPLLALFVLAWLDRRSVLVGITLCLQALFIPYLTPVCVGAVVLVRMCPRRWRGMAWVWPATWAQAGWLVGATGLALGWSASLGGAGYGPWAGARELVQPVFSTAGRYGFGVWPPASLLYELTVAPWERMAPFQEWGLMAGIGVTVLLLAGLLWAFRLVNWRALRPALPITLGLAVSSLTAYGAARIFALRFFIPNRYVIYPVHLAYAMLLGLAAHAAWRAWSPRRQSVGIFLILLAAVLGAARLRNVGLVDFSADAPVLAAMRGVPVGDQVAGPPALMDNVLAFGQRRVLVSFELAHPWLWGYWSQIEPRLSDFFAAYYTETPEVIHAFCVRHEVDWLVVDERDFPVEAGGHALSTERPRAPDFLRGRPFFAPFDEQIQLLVSGRNHFAILSSNDFPYTRIDADRRLLDMRAVR